MGVRFVRFEDIDEYAEFIHGNEFFIKRRSVSYARGNLNPVEYNAISKKARDGWEFDAEDEVIAMEASN